MSNALQLPKASVLRRVAASGLETTVLVGLLVVFSALAPFTLALTEILCVLLALYWGAKDIDGGKWSLSKRLTVTRVVDRATGEIPSRGRLVMRNSYYLILCLLSAIPLIEWATLSLVVTVMFIDLIVMVATPDSRRIGDFIANTQVIPVQAN